MTAVHSDCDGFGDRAGLDPRSAQPMDMHLLLLDLVVPRPIAMISSQSRAGIRNIAPFSYFTAVTGDPPTVAVTMGLHLDGSPKDTYRNVMATGEFVINVTAEAFDQHIERAATQYPADDDEFAIMGWTPCPSVRVGPPSIHEAPASLECEVRQVVDVGRPGVVLSQAWLVLAEVVYVTIRPELIDGRGRVDPVQLAAIGSLGGSSYLRTIAPAVYQLESRPDGPGRPHPGPAS